MSIEVKVIADSISPQGIRMRSVQIKHHRFILSEINTHRMLSKSNRSSRAVPFKKLLEEVRNDPAMPVFWGKNQPGMQAREELDETSRLYAMESWRRAALDASIHAENLSGIGLHKQIVNRLIEPFLWQHGILSGTNWNNFFALRRHPDAQPEFKALADIMWEAFEASVPVELEPGQWHLPYVEDDDHNSIRELLEQDWSEKTGEMPDVMPLSPEDDEWKLIARDISAARCARISYSPFDSDKKDILKDISLATMLRAAKHMSPFEHQATPDKWTGNKITITDDLVISDPTEGRWANPHLHANLNGWIQNRMTIPNEHVPG